MFREIGEVGQAVVLKIGFDGLEVRHASRDDSCSVSCFTELEILIYLTFLFFSAAE
jgi:hypothetical protein